eukprot:Tamp_27270.p3 GENE.Tamp_27270~~Tamp_27270.p3  ORF type:complete len:139 (+),score=8.50 Tamp_27270:247-663(+)
MHDENSMDLEAGAGSRPGGGGHRKQARGKGGGFSLLQAGSRVASRIGSAASGATLSQVVASTSARFRQLLSRRPSPQQPALEAPLASLGITGERVWWLCPCLFILAVHLPVQFIDFEHCLIVCATSVSVSVDKFRFRV